MAEQTIGTVTAQPRLHIENEQTGATTTDPAAGARAADAGVRVDPASGAVSERGPAGDQLRSVTVVADKPVFVKVAAPASSRRLVGEDRDQEEDLVLYLAGDRIPPEHRDLPTVPAVHRLGVWEPQGETTKRRR